MGSDHYSKQRYVSLNLEDIVPNGIYSFTLNPSSQFESQETRFSLMYKTIENIFDDFFNTIHVTLYPEISKLGRIHFHGYIQIIKPLDFYLHIIPKLMKVCTFEIDTYDGNSKWETYITKQKKYIEPECKNYNLPYPMTSTTIRHRKIEEEENNARQTKVSKNILKCLTKKPQ